ncbi:uncharacterized protein JN550_003021 [Neoarthrinium moseri]|uniref:uncharacterized protein n=1 Tax=Neoarthrinium moseri TaxID=1658444 RepID=UPI001FDD0473|nr:uncharacterized protein JN550_003021 [Neoarthrinium moseri]KAI1873752.1 hypothetical protein JN550_003021 [Neoarthrinium moseri]
MQWTVHACSSLGGLGSQCSLLYKGALLQGVSVHVGSGRTDHTGPTQPAVRPSRPAQFRLELEIFRAATASYARIADERAKRRANLIASTLPRQTRPQCSSSSSRFRSDDGHSEADPPATAQGAARQEPEPPGRPAVYGHHVFRAGYVVPLPPILALSPFLGSGLKKETPADPRTTYSLLGILRIQHGRMRPDGVGTASLHGRTTTAACQEKRDQLSLVEIPVESCWREEAVDDEVQRIARASLGKIIFRRAGRGYHEGVDGMGWAMHERTTKGDMTERNPAYTTSICESPRPTMSPLTVYTTTNI